MSIEMNSVARSLEGRELKRGGKLKDSLLEHGKAATCKPDMVSGAIDVDNFSMKTKAGPVRVEGEDNSDTPIEIAEPEMVGGLESVDAELINFLRTQIEYVDNLLDEFRGARENNNKVLIKEIIGKLLGLDICNAKKMDFDTGILGRFTDQDLKSQVAEQAHFGEIVFLLNHASYTRGREEMMDSLFTGWRKYKEALNALISSCEDNNI
jgi:hypothetical protein